MTSSDPQDTLVTRGADLSARLDGLAAAISAARGRLDDAALDEIATVVERSASRLRLSSEHTVVAIAGATGSGKSSTFNALTGLELSAVGVRRPTTSWASACVWGTDGAGEVLEWLGIAPRHQTTRDSMLDTRREGTALDGVVLLDLPDHDSTEVAHHLEVDRLIGKADLLIWVLDPQKYADAAIHDRYLAPMRTHSDVMLVVLNHIDTVPEERRDSMVADVRRLLELDGLGDVPVIAGSARLGWGLDELRSQIERRVSDKRAQRERLEDDVRTSAARLRELAGSDGDLSVAPQRVEALRGAFAEAAGIPTIVDAVDRSARLRMGRATGWPVVSWVSRLRPDPLKRLQLDLGTQGRSLTGAASAPSTTSVQRGRLDSEVRSLVDETTASLSRPWAAAITAAAVTRLPEIGDRLDAAVGSVDLQASRVPGWAGAVRLLQWLLMACVIGGAVWGILGTVQGTQMRQVAGLDLPWLLLGGGAAAGVLVALISRSVVPSAAAKRAAQADQRLRGAVTQVADELVLAPIETEVAAHRELRSGLARASA